MESVTLDAIWQKLEAIEARVRGDDTRPLSAKELAIRWNIPGANPARRLRTLNRLCSRRGLDRLPGQTSWDATYRFADIVNAESKNLRRK